MSLAEQRKILHQWNATAVELPRDSCLHEIFGDRARAQPDALAAVCGDRQLTYGELERAANQLAHRLRACGVGRSQPVALSLERSLEMVIGLLGILKAGAGYVPLDPSYPPDRLAFMAADAGVAALVTQAQLTPLFSGLTAPRILIDGDDDLRRQPEAPPAVEVAADDLAYLIYTSGSTGKPKGIGLDHRGRVNNFADFNRRFDVKAGDRLIALSSLSFDMTAYDVFGTLMAGATIVLPPASLEREPAHWARLMREHAVTIWHSAPAMLEMLLHQVRDRRELWPTALRLVLLGGDWISVTLPDRLRAIVPSLRVVSMGGATECSMDSTIYEVEHTDPTWKSIPYGRPMANQLAYVLDAEHQPLPVGEAGELYLGGVGVGWGYLGRPALTADKFVPNPYSGIAGDRMYRTGDIARWQTDGTLELLGRMDHQVKIRGNRIELGEITSTIERHPLVRQAAVLARDSESLGKHLVAYVVPETSTDCGSMTTPAPRSESLPGGVREYLRSQLPNYMVPTTIVVLDALPLSPNGKLDRAALPAPGPLRPELSTPYVAPRDDLEVVIATVWCHVLAVDEVGVHDSFLELGGQSLTATQVVARLAELFSVDLSLRELLTCPRLEQQADCLRRAAVAAGLAVDAIAALIVEHLPLGEDELAQILARQD